MFYIILILVFSALFSEPSTASIPSYIHVCHRNDPKVSECITSSIEDLKTILKQGIPELNVPSIDPLHLEAIKMRSGPNQAQINADLTNVKVWDVALFDFTDLQIDFNKKEILGKVHLPHLYFEADYAVDMNVLIIKYKGNGILKGNFTDYNMGLSLKYDLKDKDGKNYIHFRKIGVKVYPGKSVLKLDGLFKNDQVLARGISEVVEDNSDLFINEVLIALEDGISNTLTEVANKITDSYPFDELLPI